MTSVPLNAATRPARTRRPGSRARPTSNLTPGAGLALGSVRDLVQPPGADPARRAGVRRRRRRVGRLRADPDQPADVGRDQAHRGRVAGRHGDQHRRGHDHRLGAGPRQVRRQAHPRRHHRHPVRAPDDRRRPGAARPLRSRQPARGRRGEQDPGRVAGAGVRDPAVRGPHGAAGPGGAGARRRGGRCLPRRQAASPSSAGSSCPAWCRRSRPERPCRSLGRSPSTARWSS